MYALAVLSDDGDVYWRPAIFAAVIYFSGKKMSKHKYVQTVLVLLAGGTAAINVYLYEAETQRKGVGVTCCNVYKSSTLRLQMTWVIVMTALVFALLDDSNAIASMHGVLVLSVVLFLGLHTLIGFLNWHFVCNNGGVCV